MGSYYLSARAFPVETSPIGPLEGSSALADCSDRCPPPLYHFGMFDVAAARANDPSPDLPASRSAAFILILTKRQNCLAHH